MSFQSRIPAPAIIFAVILGLLAAPLAGIMVTQTSSVPLAASLGLGAAVLVALGMRTHIWLLIPLCWSLTGRVSLLPLPFSVRDLGVLFATGMTVIFFAMRMSKSKARVGWLEGLVLINMAWIFVLYMRNPVGVRALGSVMVGGRAYFDVGIGFLAFCVLRRVTVPPGRASLIPLLSIAGALVSGAVSILGHFFPSSIRYVGIIYSGFSMSSMLEAHGYESAQQGPGARRQEFAATGAIIIQTLCSFYRPITNLLPIHPIRLFLLLLAIFAILISGFRNMVVGASLIFLVTSYFWGGIRDVMRVLLVGVVGVMLVGMLQVLGAPIPLAAQRALSFVPFIPWDVEQVDDAMGSTQWRVEMWKIALSDERYIRNKVIGDGFGFSAYELGIMMDQKMGGAGFIGGEAQEDFLITGAFHSGPVSSIRYAGVVGLILILALQMYMAFRAPRVILSSRGTPYFPLALFICAGAILSPLIFIFVFGSYDGDLPVFMCTAGMFALVDNSIREYKERAEMPKMLPAVEPGRRSVQPGRFAPVKRSS